MNNSQFRRLLDESSSKNTSTNGATISSPSKSRNNASSTSLLGSRARSSIPMTPRSIAGHSSSNDFARQIAEHKRAALGQPAAKIFKSRAAPKGTKIAVGYQDRAALLRQQGAEEGQRNGPQDHDDKAERIQALEEMVKLQQIDQATFEKLRNEIGVGGDLESTHLVKGLDRKLLERIRRGEDVTVTKEVTHTKNEDAATSDEVGRQDVDDELENVLEKEVKGTGREERVKKGQMAAPSSLAMPAGKMSRDEILKRLKASRAVAAEGAMQATPVDSYLGSKFRKLGGENQPEKKKFVETVNGRRREVLVVTNLDGTTKRKVRWIDKEGSEPKAQGASAVSEALGMQVPAEIAAKQKAMLDKQKMEQEEDDDIFAGVGADYDPLGGIADVSDDSNSETPSEAAATQVDTDSKPVQIADKPRNYFSSTTDEDKTHTRTAPMADPSIVAALKRAAAIRRAQENAGDGDPEMDTTPQGKDFLEKLRKRERDDAADLDLGFGGSRLGDEEDEEGPTWNGEEGGKRSERKRGPKKRKANKHEMRDVMGVLEGGKK